MKYIIDKLNDVFKGNKIYFFIVLIMFCLGISFGLCSVKNMGISDKNDMISYLGNFTKAIQGQTISYSALLLEVIKKNCILLIIMIIIGITFLGFPIILIIDYIKGFILGYTFSLMVLAFGQRGLLLAIVAIMPQNILYIPCFIGLSVICLHVSSKKFKNKFSKSHISVNILSQDILSKFCMIIILFSLGVLVETYISPHIIKLVASSIKA